MNEGRELGKKRPMNKSKDGKEEEIKAVTSAMRKKWREVLAIFV